MKHRPRCTHVVGREVVRGNLVVRECGDPATWLVRVEHRHGVRRRVDPWGRAFCDEHRPPPSRTDEHGTHEVIEETRLDSPTHAEKRA